MTGGKHSSAWKLPTCSDLQELVEESAAFIRDAEEWEKSKCSPNALRHPLTILAPRLFISDEQVRGAWNNIQALPAYKKLAADPNFSNALDYFERAIQPPVVEKARFVMAVAFYICRYALETERPELVRQPDATTRKKAAAAARKMLGLARNGARLETIQDQ